MTVQATWQSVTINSLFGEEVTSVVETIRETLAVLSGIVDAVIAALEFLILVTVIDLDLIAAAVAAVIAAIDAAIDLFVATSVGVTYFAPTSYKGSVNVQTMLNRLAASFDDKTDIKRPISQNNEDYFLMWVAVGASASVKEVYEAIRVLSTLFGKPLAHIGLGESSSFYREALGNPPVYPPKPQRGQGQSPQWEGYRLADLQPFSQAVNALLSVRALFERDSNNLEQIRLRIELLQQRMQQITEQIDKLTSVTQQVIEVNAAVSGLTLLAIYGQGNTEEQQAQLLRASSLSSYPYKDVSGKETAACFVLHFQSGNGGTIDTLRKLLGVETAIAKFSNESVAEIEAQAGAVKDASLAVKSSAETLKNSWG